MTREDILVVCVPESYPDRVELHIRQAKRLSKAFHGRARQRLVLAGPIYSQINFLRGNGSSEIRFASYQSPEGGTRIVRDSGLGRGRIRFNVYTDIKRQPVSALMMPAPFQEAHLMPVGIARGFRPEMFPNQIERSKIGIFNCG